MLQRIDKVMSKCIDLRLCGRVAAKRYISYGTYVAEAISSAPISARMSYENLLFLYRVYARVVLLIFMSYKLKVHIFINENFIREFTLSNSSGFHYEYAYYY